jgi:hypothetical protein
MTYTNRFTVVCAILGMLIQVSPPCVAGDKKKHQLDESRWECVADSNLAAVFVEKVLYRSEKSEHFFVHFCVQNKAKRKIGIEFGPAAFFPAKWQGGENKRIPGNVPIVRDGPGLAFESRSPIEPEEERRWIADYRAKTLKMIPPHGFLYYYSGAGDWRSIDGLQGWPCEMICMDGYCCATDGRRAELLDAKPYCMPELGVPIRFPIKWQTIPKDAVVLSKEHKQPMGR